MIEYKQNRQLGRRRRKPDWRLKKLLAKMFKLIVKHVKTQNETIVLLPLKF